MANPNSKKAAYSLLLVSVALLAMNFSFAKIDRLSIPSTPVSISAGFLWIVMLFLLIPFANEVRNADLQIYSKISKKFRSNLASWSRKKKEREQPDLYTPQFLLSSSGFLNLKWECKYCQAGTRLDPSHTSISNQYNTLRFLLASTIKVFFSWDLLDRITLPVLSVFFAISSKAYFLLSYLLKKP
jgi:hypothetical protein